MNLPLLAVAGDVLFPGMPYRVPGSKPRACLSPESLAVVALQRAGTADSTNASDVYPFGCAARVLPSNENPWGEGICLIGLEEVTILKTIQADGGAHVLIEPSPVGGSLRFETRFHLRRWLRRVVPSGHAVGFLLDNPTVPAAFLVAAACYALPWSPIQKQWLLQASTLAKRVDRLCACMELEELGTPHPPPYSYA